MILMTSLSICSTCSMTALILVELANSSKLIFCRIEVRPIFTPEIFCVVCVVCVCVCQILTSHCWGELFSSRIGDVANYFLDGLSTHWALARLQFLNAFRARAPTQHEAYKSRNTGHVSAVKEHSVHRPVHANNTEGLRRLGITWRVTAIVAGLIAGFEIRSSEIDCNLQVQKTNRANNRLPNKRRRMIDRFERRRYARRGRI